MARSIALMTLLFLITLFSLNGQILDHYPIHSIEVETLDRFFLEIGQSPPFYSRPYSNYQFLRYLRRVESRKNELSAHNRALLNKLLLRLSSQENKFTFFIPVLESNVRLQYQNEEITDFDKYLYYRKSIDYAPLINLGFTAGLPYFIMHSENDLRRDFFATFRPANYTNLPVGSPFVKQFDFNFPTRSYLKFGGSYLDLLIGREQMKWGPGYRSSLVLSDSPPYYDMLHLSYFSDFFKASFFFSVLESYLTEAEFNIQETMEYEGSVSFGKDATDQYKTLTGHRFEFNFFNRALFGISDIIVIGGRVPEFNEITPLMYLHNVYGENYSNVIFGFDTSIVPCRNIQIYGEFAIDDIRNANEGGESPPTSLGYLAGVYVMKGFAWGNLNFRFEWARVDPWMYNRWQPYLIFSSRKKLLSLATADWLSYLDFPTGYFLGGDVQSFYFEISYDYQNTFEAALSYELRQKGRIYLNVLDPESEFANFVGNPSSTPTGTPVISHIVGLSGAYELSTMLFLSGELALGYQYNREHRPGNNGFFFEALLNCTFKLDREKY